MDKDQNIQNFYQLDTQNKDLIGEACSGISNNVRQNQILSNDDYQDFQLENKVEENVALNILQMENQKNGQDQLIKCQSIDSLKENKVETPGTNDAAQSSKFQNKVINDEKQLYQSKDESSHIISSDLILDQSSNSKESVFRNNNMIDE
ncbi:UNKNOWN [Stylonychia lemnae]|uniref:Uncharacterized protein n=1 Tax=Stylonychia lemnae TaxID=5949 RepID=A0A078AP15_STYLE|nr:UNKNOWN [Stylonychia lemnae]|eukprot:CDW83676.1 UNKNOWN [Stylonychia lemnae]